MINNQFTLNILLAVAWTLLTGHISAENFIEGLIIGYIILWISRSAFGASKYFRKIPKAISFFFYFLKELIVANIKVAYDIITPTDYMKPGIIAIPLDAETDFEITLLANLITLTPGTLSLDVSSDKKVLYLHALYVDDPEKFKLEIKNELEKKLLEVLR
jgi:multicomponent Na+:H+ antiporter subunit E